MSLTCVHSLANAPAHPYCEGCRAVPVRAALPARETVRGLAGYIVSVDPGGGLVGAVIVGILDRLKIPDVSRRAPAITAMELEHAVAAAELKAELRHAASPAYLPGARRPGTKPTPPVPRWARDRRPR